jgi:histidinol dehydrogenase
MRILDWSRLSRAERRAALARPAPKAGADVRRVAAEIVSQVRTRGDAALRAFTQRFDKAQIDDPTVTYHEFERARGCLSSQELAALGRAIVNVERFHSTQASPSVALETEPGVRCETVVRPMSLVGLYVPGGTAPLVSAVVMLAIPARIAGCTRRILCTPPRADGSIHPALLVAARLCGVESVYKIGGAQAIAALAYGTETIPKVNKIFGPGNAWVTAAKELVCRDPAGAACDLPAGPSEVLVVADETANAAFVASDLLAQAEHDVLSQALLVTDSRTLAKDVQSELAVQRLALSRGKILKRSLTACRALVVPDLDAALRVANEYAPEHLILEVRDPRRYLAYVQNAGAVFLGSWSPEPLGDYCTGSNHVLPTYGHARALSGLSVRDFIKTISVQELTPEGLKALGPTAIALAELEGLDGHASAVERRLAALKSTGGSARVPAQAAGVSP